ncbi:50S ribosomal protein L1 [Candidatus Saccharibacteria bacterium]|nr:50S ribosomal protein L1 [Candidatus Saccharibacteria bacterium]
MAKKADLLEIAKQLKLAVSEKNTIAEIETAIAEAKKIEAPAEDKEVVADREAPIAKAGKRSQKAIEEVEAKLEKEARKEAGDTTPQDSDAEANIKKGPAPITRPKADRRGKNYKQANQKIEQGRVYSLQDAVKLAVETNPSKFDASVEVHVRLGVDPRQADQNIRATVALPHGTGKTIRVAVFAPDADQADAKKAGADIVGDETFIKQLDKEELNFDILITTPQYMPKLSKYARLLGPRGLMPNPKSGTVAHDVSSAVKDAKTGKVEYRVDKQAIVHLSIGKVSFGEKKIAENAASFFASLNAQKPSGIKGVFIKSISLSTTMGPGIKVEQTA